MPFQGVESYSDPQQWAGSPNAGGMTAFQAWPFRPERTLNSAISGLKMQYIYIMVENATTFRNIHAGSLFGRYLAPHYTLIDRRSKYRHLKSPLRPILRPLCLQAKEKRSYSSSAPALK